jgi:hypothetical protein
LYWPLYQAVVIEIKEHEIKRSITEQKRKKKSAAKLMRACTASAVVVSANKAAKGARASSSMRHNLFIPIKTA